MNAPIDWRDKPMAERLRLLRSLRANRPPLWMPLHEFARQVWPIIEPGIEFCDNWHLRLLSEKLTAVARGDIKRLLINVPPGTSKSLWVSVIWPAWIWGPFGVPARRIVAASYSQAMATRDSLRTRNIVESEWYRERWPQVVVSADQSAKQRFITTAAGWRVATSVGGLLTGEHPDIVIADDPHSAFQAESEAKRLAALEWWDGTVSTRGMTRDVAQVIVMQRLHAEDLSGHVLSKSGESWDHVCLPMRFESDRACEGDPRTEEGELLWPDLFPEEKVRRLEEDLGSRVAGQLQQRPPDHYEGAEWPSSFFADDRIYCDSIHPPEETAYRVAAVDPSLGRTDKSDFAAVGVLTLGFDGSIRVKARLERLDIQALCRLICDVQREHDPMRVGIEANGFQSLIEPLLAHEAREQGVGIPTAAIHNHTDKLTRIRSITGYLARGEIQIVDDPGGRELVRQLKAVPGGVHDDGPDMLEMGVRLLRAMWADANG